MSADDGLLADLEALPRIPAGGRLAGKVAIVSGAGSPPADVLGVGIGAASARLLAREGASVVIADIDREAGDRTVASIEADGASACAVDADATDEADCARVVQAAVTSYGGLDVLVNNLGIDGGGFFGDTDGAAWDRVMSVNVKSVMLMTKQALPLLKPGASVINISSISAQRPMFSRADYSASKGAVNSLTLALAVQYGRAGIRFNGISPGTPWTAMSARPFRGKSRGEIEAVRRRRLEMPLLPVEGTAWDIAEVVAFLASPQARWITGQLITVDGGTTLHPHWDELGKR